MVKQMLALATIALFAAGCGVETRTYVITKPRVGLDVGNGNAGCIQGKCDPQPAPKETTRKVYVLEITRPVPESEVQKIETTAVNVITTPGENASAGASAPAPAAGPAVDNSQPAAGAPVVQVIGETPGSNPPPEAAEANNGNVQPTTYTVQKDDTLQKISKKIYGSYGKWYKIYEANKDKISNPNILKPGTVLTIPSIK